MCELYVIESLLFIISYCCYDYFCTWNCFFSIIVRDIKRMADEMEEI